MNTKKLIAADSCCDIFDIETKGADTRFERVPLTIHISDTEYTDDENLDIAKMAEHMNATRKASSTACPSPEAFRSIFEDADEAFAIAISAKMSGTYASADTAKSLFEGSGKKIHIIDSRSASAGEILLALKLSEYMQEEGATFESVREKIEAFRDSMATFFILRRFDNFIKSGRMSKAKGIIAGILRVCPVCGDDGNGMIKVYDTLRTRKKAFNRLIELIGDRVDPRGRTLVICHNDNLEEAEALRDMALAAYPLKDVKIYPMRGIATFYANVGGLVVAL